MKAPVFAVLLVAAMAVGCMADSVELLYAKGLYTSQYDDSICQPYGCTQLYGEVKVVSDAGLDKHVFSHMTNSSLGWTYTTFPWYDLTLNYTKKYTDGSELWTFRTSKNVITTYPTANPGYQLCLKMTYTSKPDVHWSSEVGQADFFVSAGSDDGTLRTYPTAVFGSRKAAVYDYSVSTSCNTNPCASTLHIKQLKADLKTTSIVIKFQLNGDARTTYSYTLTNPTTVTANNGAGYLQYSADIALPVLAPSTNKVLFWVESYVSGSSALFLDNNNGDNYVKTL